MLEEAIVEIQEGIVLGEGSGEEKGKKKEGVVNEGSNTPKFTA